MKQKERLQTEKDMLRERFLKYARQAFEMLPPMDKPRILDIGCGSGVPAIELAESCNGDITCLDIDQNLLDVLAGKIEKAGLTDRVRVVNCSIFDMAFPDESFDVIWAEGSIYVIGFEKGLKEWKRLIKPNGFMVIHDEASNIAEKLGQISNSGYGLLGYFALSEKVWHDEYIAPLEKLVQEIQTENAGRNSDVTAMLEAEKRDIEMFKQNPARQRSVYFVLKNR